MATKLYKPTWSTSG